MEKGKWDMLIIVIMKDNLKMERNMAQECIFGQMGPNIRGAFIRISTKDLE
jgi:hypothetical protein